MKQLKNNYVQFSMLALVRVGILSVTLLTAWGISTTARADEVVMKNGDRLSGTVLRKKDDILRFRTSYAGVLFIKWQQVREIKTVRSVKVVFTDGSEHLTREVQVEGGIVTVVPAEQAEKNTYTNVEIWSVKRPSRSPAKGRLSGRVDLSLKLNRGNGDSDNFDFYFDTTYRKRKNRLRVFGEWEIDTVNQREKRRRWNLSGTYSRFFNKKNYLALWVGFENDILARLDLRTRVGPFIGYQFFETERLNLLLEGGVVRVFEDYTNQPDDEFTQPTWHINFDKYLFKGPLQIFFEHFGSIDLGSEKRLVNTRTGFRFPISGGFLGSLEARLNYNSEPAAGADTTETTYRFKLGYRW